MMMPHIDSADRNAVWHKDGPLAQIEAMAEWLDWPLDAEHRRKVQTNLRAAVAALRGGHEQVRRNHGSLQIAKASQYEDLPEDRERLVADD